MNKYPESFLKSFGDYSCYLLSLIKLAEDQTGFEYDIFTVLKICSQHVGPDGKPWIFYNWSNFKDTNNFTVNHPHEILGLLTGVKWSITKEPENYKAKRGELVVECWYNAGNKHFRLKDFDPLFESVTVKKGKIDSYRVFRRA